MENTPNTPNTPAPTCGRCGEPLPARAIARHAGVSFATAARFRRGEQAAMRHGIVRAIEDALARLTARDEADAPPGE